MILILIDNLEASFILNVKQIRSSISSTQLWKFREKKK